MKRIFALSVALTLVGLAQDQQTMNRQAHEHWVRADKKLNEVYKKLVPTLSDSEKKNLIEAQQAWVRFRDSDARARAAENEGGSLYPLIYDGTRARTTEARTAELQDWLNDRGNR